MGVFLAYGLGTFVMPQTRDAQGWWGSRWEENISKKMRERATTWVVNVGKLSISMGPWFTVEEMPDRVKWFMTFKVRKDNAAIL